MDGSMTLLVSFLDRKIFKSRHRVSEEITAFNKMPLGDLVCLNDNSVIK